MKACCYILNPSSPLITKKIIKYGKQKQKEGKEVTVDSGCEIVGEQRELPPTKEFEPTSMSH